MDVRRAKRVPCRPYRFQTIAAVFVGVLVPPEVVSGIIIPAIAIGMPEIKPCVCNVMAIPVKHRSFDNQFFPRSAAGNIGTFRGAGGIKRSFLNRRR
ncbi:MAG: hypothetical protein A2144_09070 [Chloroflexi bacterium RBG_16_50_9]|nr:MAG: hypothetical protein A2144_09070 [Chloroflexi bacterium RBG_16_50_9]